MKGIRAVLFDLDGTLVDSREDLTTALNTALVAYGAPVLAVEAVTDLIGEGALRLVERALPPELRGRSEAILARFLEEYGRQPVVETRPYAGIREALESLGRTMLLGVVSNKQEGLSREVLERLSLLKHFKVVVGPDTTGERKPSPVPLRFALATLGVRVPSTAVIVGDSSFDIAAGRAAGMGTVGVTWGYRPESELAAADVRVHRPEELLRVLSGEL